MSGIGFIFERLEARKKDAALFWRGQAYAADWVIRQVRQDIDFLVHMGIGPGAVVILRGDYSPRTVSLLLALIELSTVLAPLLPSTLARTPALMDVVNPEFRIESGPDGEVAVVRCEQSPQHHLVQSLTQARRPGLILFTSGSTGQPRAVVHDFERLLTKFHKRRPALRTLNFLLFDHWGGLNTLLHCLANGSPVVLPEEPHAGLHLSIGGEPTGRTVAGFAYISEHVAA